MAYDCFSGNVFDIRDVMKRFEELESEKGEVRESSGAADVGWDNRDEFNEIKAFLEDVKGYGGDEQWRGDWYPATFIRSDYFKDYAKELAEECGMVQPGASWPNNCIDWDEAARQLKQDYASVDIEGDEFWYR